MACPSCSGRPSPEPPPSRSPAAAALAWACGDSKFLDAESRCLAPCAGEVVAIGLPALALGLAVAWCGWHLGSQRHRRRRRRRSSKAADRGAWWPCPTRPSAWAGAGAALAAILLVTYTVIIGADKHLPTSALVAGFAAAAVWMATSLVSAAATAVGSPSGRVMGPAVKTAAWVAAAGSVAVAGPALAALLGDRSPGTRRNAAAAAWTAAGFSVCAVVSAAGLSVAGRDDGDHDRTPSWLLLSLAGSEEAEDLPFSSSDDGEAGGGAHHHPSTAPPPGGGGPSFGWVAPLIATGASRPLQQADLFAVPATDKPLAAGGELAAAWLVERARAASRGSPATPSLPRLAWTLAGRWRWVRLGALKAGSDALNFAGPLFLHALVSYVGPEEDRGDDGSGGGSATTTTHPHPPLHAVLALLLPPHWLPAPGTASYGLACAAGLASAAALKALLNAHYSYGVAALSARARAALGAAVAGASLTMKQAAAAPFSAGDATTLATLDVDRVASSLASAHDGWALPVQVAVALALLYTQVQWAFAAGVAVVLALIPANRVLARRIEAASGRQQGWRGTRLAAVADLLRGSLTVKAAGWEPAFAARIAGARAGEVRQLRVRKMLDALCVFSWAVTSLLTMLATFGAAAWSGVQLGSAAAFTCLALFGVLVAPLNSLPWVIGGLVDAGVSARRLRTYLVAAGDGLVGVRGDGVGGAMTTNGPPTPSPRRLAGTDAALPADRLMFGGAAADAADGSAAPPDGLAIAVSHATLAWDGGGGGGGGATPPIPSSLPPPALTDICLALRAGALAVVVGDAGAGKSSLLAAIAGEMALRTGSVRVAGRLAYVPQSPWCAGGLSVRDNILLGGGTGCGAIDAARYAASVAAAALDADFAAWPAGDGTPVGDGGTGLSGGQRARVGLARALYARRDVYLLDDPLSALDARVASHVAAEALAGPGALLRGTTRVIASHSPALAAAADVVIRVARGRVVSATFGPQQSVAAAGKAAVRLRSAAGVAPTPLPPASQALPGDTTADPEAALLAPTTASTTTAEHRATGAVSRSVYAAYLHAAGGGLVAAVLVSVALMQATRNGADWWLAAWVTAEDAAGRDYPPSSIARSPSPLPDTTAFYLAGLAALAAANSAFTLARAFSYAAAGLRAAVRLHDRMVAALLAAPPAFFVAQASGRILNRCSADVAVVDDDLPFVANVALASGAGLVGALAILGAAQPALLPALLPLGLAYRALQRRYSASARELRRLGALARSPVVAGVADAVAGGPVLRSLCATGAAATVHAGALEAAQEAALSAAAASQWLALRLQLIAAGVAGAAGAAAVAGHEGWLGRGGGRAPGGRHSLASSSSAGLVGLSLAYALPLTSLLGSALTAGAETEQELVSVERVVEFCGVEAQPARLPPHQGGGAGGAAAGRVAATLALPGWPFQGGVAFSDVWLRYSPAGPYALAGATLTVPPGTTMGVCGRTGAGKSTLIAALTRLAETSAGVVTIDGVDVRAVPLPRLRSAVAFVSQSPFVFAGSVRDNLDPLGVHGDGVMVAALKAARLWDVLAGLALAQLKHHRRRHGRPGGSRRPSMGGGASSTASEDDSSDGGSSSGGAHHHHRRGGGGGGLRRLRHASSPMSMAVRRAGAGAPPPGGPPPRSPSSGSGSGSGGGGGTLLAATPITTPTAAAAATATAAPWCSAPVTGGWAGQAGTGVPTTTTSSLLDWHASTSVGGLRVGRGEVGVGASPRAAVIGASPRTALGASPRPAGAPPPPPPRPVRTASSGGLAAALAREGGDGRSAGTTTANTTTPTAPAPPSPQRQPPSPAAAPPLIDFFADEEEENAAAAASTPAIGAQVLGVRLGEAGAGLSAGQAQQLCLARALIRGAAVVCLDEVTSVAEPAAAAALQAAVRVSLAGTTVIQVAHSLDAVMGCDAAAVMDGGVVVEVGPPGELAADPGSALAAMVKAAGKAPVVKRKEARMKERGELAGLSDAGPSGSR